MPLRGTSWLQTYEKVVHLPRKRNWKVTRVAGTVVNLKHVKLRLKRCFIKDESLLEIKYIKVFNFSDNPEDFDDDNYVAGAESDDEPSPASEDEVEMEDEAPGTFFPLPTITFRRINVNVFNRQNGFNLNC